MPIYGGLFASVKCPHAYIWGPFCQCKVSPCLYMGAFLPVQSVGHALDLGTPRLQAIGGRGDMVRCASHVPRLHRDRFGPHPRTRDVLLLFAVAKVSARHVQVRLLRREAPCPDILCTAPGGVLEQLFFSPLWTPLVGAYLPPLALHDLLPSYPVQFVFCLSTRP